MLDRNQNFINLNYKYDDNQKLINNFINGIKIEVQAKTIENDEIQLSCTLDELIADLEKYKILKIKSYLMCFQVKKLSEALAGNTTVSELCLTGNNLGDDSAAELANMLKQNTRLVTVNLSRNNITNAGVKHLVDAIQNNTVIREINLDENPAISGGSRRFKSDEQAKLEKILENNKKLIAEAIDILINSTENNPNTKYPMYKSNYNYRIIIEYLIENMGFTQSNANHLIFNTNPNATDYRTQFDDQNNRDKFSKGL